MFKLYDVLVILASIEDALDKTLPKINSMMKEIYASVYRIIDMHDFNVTKPRRQSISAWVEELKATKLSDDAIARIVCTRITQDAADQAQATSYIDTCVSNFIQTLLMEKEKANDESSDL